MVIRVYQSQIRADKRPTVSSSPSINTGATEFYSSLADTISRTGNELGEFFIKKKEKELALQSEIELGSVSEELTNLYNSYLDPQSEIFLTPEKWVEGNESFETKANELINNKYNTIENKIVADTVKSKFIENFITLEKDLTKQSFARTDDLLQSNVNLRHETVIKDMSNTNNLEDMLKLVDNLYLENEDGTINTNSIIGLKFASGYYKEGETPLSMVNDSVNQVVANRIVKVTSKMNPTQVSNAFKTNNFNDPIINNLINRLPETDKAKLLAETRDIAIKNIDAFSSFQNNADSIFNDQIKIDINDMMSTADFNERVDKKNKLLELAAGDKEQISIIKSNFDPNYFYSSFDSMDVESVIAGVYSGRYSEDDIYGTQEKPASGLRDEFTKKSWLKIQDAYANTYLKSDKGKNQILNRLKRLFLIDEDPTQTDDIENAMGSVAKAAFVQVDKLMDDKSLSEDDIIAKITKESKSARDGALYDLFVKELELKTGNILKDHRSKLTLNGITITKIRPQFMEQDFDNVIKMLEDKGLKTLFRNYRDTLLFKYSAYGVFEYANTIGQ
tara:strand:+ start:120 stop:1805 length:1686 start_codon:yes stop_codon:yes gene_type:complete